MADPRSVGWSLNPGSRAPEINYSVSQWHQTLFRRRSLVVEEDVPRLKSPAYPLTLRSLLALGSSRRQTRQKVVGFVASLDVKFNGTQYFNTSEVSLALFYKPPSTLKSPSVGPITLPSQQLSTSSAPRGSDPGGRDKLFGNTDDFRGTRSAVLSTSPRLLELPNGLHIRKPVVAHSRRRPSADNGAGDNVPRYP